MLHRELSPAGDVPALRRAEFFLRRDIFNGKRQRL